MRILFQGDSITDAGRDKRNYHNMGNGYPKYAAEQIAAAHPDIDFEFINFGISGNRTGQLFDRLYPDAIVFQPDIVSVLIGVNDVWHRYNKTACIKTTDEQIELNYRQILTRLKNETNAKIITLSPYLLDAEDKEHMREGIERAADIAERLAEEFADAYVPLNKLFAEALKTQPEPKYYSADGVHPNENGARFIAKHYAEAAEKLLR
ncbi:MAG: SGNH/GDSL hydrolase family protein [Clostridia bacterium]|nr:SGNH/GDSL hydrolase family protein [Clostridia bacterium]